MDRKAYLPGCVPAHTGTQMIRFQGTSLARCHRTIRIDPDRGPTDGSNKRGDTPCESPVFLVCSSRLRDVSKTFGRRVLAGGLDGGARKSTGTMGLASYTRRAPRRFEAQGRPEARIGFRKAANLPVPRSFGGMGPDATGPAPPNRTQKASGQPRGNRGAGPALPLLWCLTTEPTPSDGFLYSYLLSLVSNKPVRVSISQRCVWRAVAGSIAGQVVRQITLGSPLGFCFWPLHA